MLDEIPSFFWQKCSPNPTREALGALLAQSGGLLLRMEILCEKLVPLRRKRSPFWEAFGVSFGTFSFSGLRNTKKGGPGGHSKLEPFFGQFWDLPVGPQEGSRLHGSSIRPFAQCAHCTVCSLYSVLTVQCAHCTACSLYSEHTLQ